MKYLLFFTFLFMSSLSFGQKEDMQTVKIESGSLSKKYIDGKLESFTVEMYAVNYGGVLAFSKENDTISINSGEKSNTVLKIYFKNKMRIYELLYKNKRVLCLESVNFDLDNLPKSTTIYRTLINNKIESYSSMSDFKNLDEDFDESLMKIFNGLIYSTDLVNIDSVFNSIADFFSNEDALYRIYVSSYAEKLMPPITGYLKTNERGKIESGIIWTEKESGNGKYEIYNKEKIVESKIQSLLNFKETLQDYFTKKKDDI